MKCVLVFMDECVEMPSIVSNQFEHCKYYDTLTEDERSQHRKIIVKIVTDFYLT